MLNSFKFDCNEKLVSADVNTLNLPGKPSLITVRFQFHCEYVDKLMMYIKISVIDDKDGMRYRKEFMRTAIDVPKLFNGGLTSMIGRTFLNGLAEAADFDLKFPLTKVKFRFIVDRFHESQFSYRAPTPSATSRSQISSCHSWWRRTWLLICVSPETSRKAQTRWTF